MMAALFGGAFSVETVSAEVERPGARSAPRRSPALRYQVSTRNDIVTGRTSNLGKVRGTWLLCSRPVFPAWFNQRVRRLASNPLTPSLLFKHAERFFGRKLTVDVDPAKLRTQLHPQVFDGRNCTRLDWRFLDAADWSGAIRPFTTNPTRTAMVELTEHGAGFRDMPAYQALLRSVAAGRPVYRNGVALDSRQMLDAYFLHYLELIRHIRAEGVVRRREAAPRASTHQRLRGLEAEANERNPGVAIDADGTLVRFMSGRHRTAIAQALRLPLLPVEVRLVHVAWLMDTMVETQLPAHEAFLAGLARLDERSSARRT